MTMQERHALLERFMQHFVRDCAPKSVNSGSCLYRKFDKNGKVVAKCAVGMEIPDELYSRRLETKCLSNDLFKPIRQELGWTPEDCVVLTSMQNLHDREFSIDDTIEDRKAKVRTWAQSNKNAAGPLLFNCKAMERIVSPDVVAQLVEKYC